MTSDHVPDFVSEYYTVEKTIDLVVNLGPNSEATSVRIEALRNGRTGQYTTHVFHEEHLTAQPTYPQQGDQHTQKPRDFRIWVKFDDFPWTQGRSAEDVTRRALSFLEEKCSG